MSILPPYIEGFEDIIFAGLPRAAMVFCLRRAYGVGATLILGFQCRLSYPVSPSAFP